MAYSSCPLASKYSTYGPLALLKREEVSQTLVSLLQQCSHGPFFWLDLFHFLEVFVLSWFDPASVPIKAFLKTFLPVSPLVPDPSGDFSVLLL